MPIPEQKQVRTMRFFSGAPRIVVIRWIDPASGMIHSAECPPRNPLANPKSTKPEHKPTVPGEIPGEIYAMLTSGDPKYKTTRALLDGLEAAQ